MSENFISGEESSERLLKLEFDIETVCILLTSGLLRMKVKSCCCDTKTI